MISIIRSSKWAGYSDEPEERNMKFFDEVRPVKETLNGYFGSRQVLQILLINGPFVENCIGEMLLNPDDEEQRTTHERIIH